MDREISFEMLKMFNAAFVSRFIRCLFFAANMVHVLRRVSSSSSCFVDDEEEEELGEDGEGVDAEEECDVKDVRRICTGLINLLCNSRARDIASTPRLDAPCAKAALRILSRLGLLGMFFGAVQCENPINTFSSSL